MRRVLLTMNPGTDHERIFALAGARTVIGRSAQTDLRLALPSVALHHCEIHNDRDGVRLSARDHQNVVEINGVPCDQGLLDEGDHLRIGSVEFRVSMREEPIPTIEIKESVRVGGQVASPRSRYE